MTELSRSEWEAYESFNDWMSKDQRRVCYEWDKEWDGTEAHGIAINDRQCNRINSARSRLGIDGPMMMRFRAMERERLQCAK